MEGLGNQSSPFSFSIFLFTDSHIKREGRSTVPLLSRRNSNGKPKMLWNIRNLSPYATERRGEP